MGVGVGSILQEAQREKAGHAAGFWGPRGPREPRGPCAHSHLILWRPLNVQAPYGHRAQGAMRLCGVLTQLLGCCPGSIMAVLVLVTHGRDAGFSCLRAGGVSWAQWRRLQQAGWSWLPGPQRGHGVRPVVWPWGWPRQGLKGKGPSIPAQSRGLGATCLGPHRSLGSLGGNCIAGVCTRWARGARHGRGGPAMRTAL